MNDHPMNDEARPDAEKRLAEEEANRRWRFDQYMRSVMNAGDQRVIDYGALPRQKIWR